MRKISEKIKNENIEECKTKKREKKAIQQQKYTKIWKKIPLKERND